MFSKFFIHRPVFACVVSIVIFIAGFIGLTNLPVEEYPQLTPPQIVVSASYPGADAQTIADTVAAPLEDAINGVEDIIYMQSTSSSSGMMQLSVYFKIGTDPQTASVNVNNKVRSAEALLPEEVKRLGVSASERSTSILEVVSFYDPEGSMDIIDLNNYVSINVIEALKRVPGVGEAVIIGEKKYSMRVWINPDMLNKYGLTATDVIAAIKEQNSQYASGKLGENPVSSDDASPYVFSIKPEGRLVKVSEFENIIIKAEPNGSMLRLKDIAKVELGTAQYSFGGGILNGKTMAPVLIFMQNGANALATAQAVNDEIERLSKNFPGTLTYEVPYNTTEFVKVSIQEVIKTFAEAILLVLIVMYLFLGNIRSTIIPMIAVPVSIVGTFAGLYVAGFSINMITLFALILAIGIVVDDAIIVVENVERILEHDPNISVVEATEKAMGEIMAPVISIVLVLSAVFIPVSFMEGFVGVIQREFAITLVISVCISGLVALTLTPALCAVFLKREHKEKNIIVRGFNKIFDVSTDIYAAGVAKVLRHILPSLIVVGILCYLLFTMSNMIPKGLVPMEDKGSAIAVVQLPAASTISRTAAEMDKMTKQALADPNIEFAIGMVGYDLFAGALRENSGVFFLDLIDWKDRKGKENSSFALVGKYNGIYSQSRESLSFVLSPPPIMGLSMTGGFELYAQNLTGKSYAQIEQDMRVISQKANAREDLQLVRTTLDTGYPQYNLSVNTEKAKMLGVNIADIFATMNSIIGQYYVNDFNLLGKTFKVYLRSSGEYRNSPSDLARIFVRNNQGGMIPLNSLISLERSLGADTLDRFNGLPAAKIMGDPAAGYTSAEAIEAISKVFEENFPNEYSIGWSGTSYQEVSSSGKGMMAFVFGLIFVYLILAAQYERWLMPAAVMTAVPFSVFGAMLFTLLRGLSNDIYFQIGLILLIGLGAKNAILIVEFAMAQREKGADLFKASIGAARLRFRPIVMTSIAFGLGVLPMVLSSGAGSASRHSLGTGVIGGMMAASTIAIFFIPMFYYLFEKFGNFLDSRKSAKAAKNIENRKRENDE